MQNRTMSIEDRLIVLGLFFDKIEKDDTDILGYINLFQKNIDNGLYKDISITIYNNKNSEAQLNLLIYLFSNVINNRRLITNKYIDLVEICNKYINFNLGSVDDVISRFNYAQNLYNEFIKKYSYIIENYLVNMMFTHAFPCNDKTPLDSYIDLMINFIPIKFIAICLCGYYKENMSEDILVSLIHIYSINVNHTFNIN